MMKAHRVLFRQPTTLLFSIAFAAAICRAQAQPAPTPTPTPTAVPETAAPATAPVSEPGASTSSNAVVLSPFDVNASKDQGYFAANTLAGTRLNNNIADLGSSITVVTKQQMDDTNSVNINDIFRYEANTEGRSTYTPVVLVRSNIQEGDSGGGGTSGNYTSASDTGFRVRGLSVPDEEEDNFFSLYRIPFDAYNTAAVDIERGPNSIIFGSGSPAGIVNQDRIQADVTKQTGETDLQVSSWGGYRESIGLNIPIIKDRLAIYLGQLYESQGFEEKPSFDISRREYGAFTLYPFKNHKTKITGSYEYYNNNADDPNQTTPLDYVTPWLQAGRPMWNPLTDTVTYLSTGKTTQTYTISSTYPNYQGVLQTALSSSTSPYFVPSLTILNSAYILEQVGQNGVETPAFETSQIKYTVPGYVPTTFTPAQALIAEERYTTTTNLPIPANELTYQQPGVTSKSIYDWSTINVNAMGNTQTAATTYNLNFEQEILPNLNFSASWFRQELIQTIDEPLAQANGTSLLVDTNAYLPNGAINTHAGQDYLNVYQSDVYSEPEINNNYRAMLDYEPDLRTFLPTWLDWLGHHRFLGIFTQHDDVQTNLRFRPSIDGGDPNYLPTAATLANTAGYAYTSNSTIDQWFYMGGLSSAANGFANSAATPLNRPGYGGPTTVNMSSYNYTTGTWNPSTIHVDSILFSTGGLSENIQDSKTFFWQSFFFNDRLVGSLGIDDDQVKNRSTLFPATLPTAAEYTNGQPNTKLWYDEGPWSYIGGNTNTMGFVLHAFKNWAGLDAAADRGNLAAALLRTLSFTFNKADNFNPPTSHQTDYFGVTLPKPQGTEKDYGMEIATPNNKFFLRYTYFTTSNENAVTTFTSTARANYIDQTLLKDWATEVVEVRNGESPSDPNFNNTNVYPITAAEQAQIAAVTGLPYNYGGNVGATGEYVAPTGTESGIAKGGEVEATYNPLPNWTMKVTWGRQQTTVSGAAAQAQAWVSYRMPTWLKYTAPDLAQTYTLASGQPLYLGSFWSGYGYDANTNFTSTTPNTQAYYNAVVGSQLAVDEANNGSLAPNQREFSWAYLTNYTFDRGPLKHLSIGGALRYDGRATAGYYGDTANLNSAGQIAAPNIYEPIYTPGRFHIDLEAAYSFKMPWTALSQPIWCKVQVNVADVTSNGYLVPITYNFDGTPAAESIVSPRSFSLSTRFSF